MGITMGRTLLLFFCMFLGLTTIVLANEEEDQFAHVKGKVTTADGKPAPYVTVQITGTTKGAVTDENGEFSIRRLTPGTYTLHITLVGFEPVEKQVTTEAGQTAHVSFELQLNDKQLQEVVISGQRRLTSSSSDYANKMTLKNLENAQTSVTISKELMKEQVVLTVDDAVRNVPGLTKMWDATGRSGDGGSYYNLRGFIVQSQLRNGVAGNVSSRIDVANLEKIEVLKGPSATLFGNVLTSYGGLINRVTKKPYDGFGGEVNFTAGNYGLYRMGADVNAPLDKEHNVLLRVNAAYSYEGSWQDNGWARNFVFAPSLSYKVNDKLSFLFDAEFAQGNNTGLNVYFFPYGLTMNQLGYDRADQLKVDYKRSYVNDDIYQTARNINFFGQMNYKMSGNWTSQTNFTVTNSFSDGPSPYFYLLPNNMISRNDQYTDNSKDQVIEIQQNFIGDFQIGSLRNRLTAGLDFFYRNSDQFFGGNTLDTIDVSLDTIANYRNFNRTNLDKLYQEKGNSFIYPSIFTTNTYSAYVSDVLNLTDNLMVLGALRVDHYVYNGAYDATTGKTSGAYNQTKLSPKLGIVYQPIKDAVALFANYQNGFTNKAPGTDGLGHPVPYKPEQANQWETGVKVDLFEGKLTSTVSYYDIRVKDVLRPTEQPNVYKQDGTQYSKGVDVEVIASPFRGMSVVAGFAYNDSKYEKATDKNVEGRRPGTAGAPTVANLWLSYRIPGGNLKGLGFGFGGNYASDNKIINDATLGVFTLPSYTVLNASVFYDQPKFRVSAKMDNLTNEKYWIGYTTVNPQKLRSFAASLAFKF